MRQVLSPFSFWILREKIFRRRYSIYGEDERIRFNGTIFKHPRLCNYLKLIQLLFLFPQVKRDKWSRDEIKSRLRTTEAEGLDLRTTGAMYTRRCPAIILRHYQCLELMMANS